MGKDRNNAWGGFAAGRRFGRSGAVLFFMCALALAIAFCAQPAHAATKYLSTEGDSISADEAEQQSGQDQQEEEKTYDPMAQGVADGTYIGTGEGFKSTIMVQVTVKDEKITEVKILSENDDQEYFNWASKITDDIVQYQSSEVDSITGASYSSRGIKDAVYDALKGDGSTNQTAMLFMTIGTWVTYACAALGLAGLVLFTARSLRARKRAQRLAANRWQRISSQLLFFALAPAVFASGFMGVKSVLQTVADGSVPTVSTFVVLLLALLAFTVLFGRFFCGYACAFGFFGDIFYQLGGFVMKKLGVKKRPALPRKLSRVFEYLKYAVLVAVLAAVLAGASQFINDNSPWTAYSRLTSFTVRGVTAVSAVLLAIIWIGSIFEKRFFCRFFCPMGALFSLMPTVPKTGRVKWNRPNCFKNCNACQNICPVDVHPHGKLLAGECITCGRCAEVCPADNIRVGLAEARLPLLGTAAPEKDADATTDTNNAANLQANVAADASSRTAEAPKSSRANLLRSHPAGVVVKAALLMLAFWLLGITKILPVLPL